MEILKKLLSSLLLIGLGQASIAQDYQSEFAKHFHAKDTVAQLATLQKWEATNTDDPALYTSYFNYYIIQSRKEVVEMRQAPPSDGDALAMQDSLGNTVGYMVSGVHYENNVIQKGLDYIDIGIEKFPRRLDMRYGKAYLLLDLNRYDDFAQAIINVLDYYDQMEGKWLWTNGEIIEESKVRMLSPIQDYMVRIFGTENDDLLPIVVKVGERVIQSFPDDVPSRSNIAIAHIYQKEYQKGVDQLLEAEKINPKDVIVLNNIGNCYEEMGNKKLALRYYKKALKYADPREKAYIEETIEGLKE